MPKVSISKPLWIVETDGSSKEVGEGASLVLQSLKGLLVAQAVKFSSSISNNKGKCEAVLLSL